jgi:apoptosis-inducing factor 2
MAELLPEAIVAEGDAKNCIRVARSMQIAFLAGPLVDTDRPVHGTEHAHHSLADADPSLSCVPAADTTYEDDEEEEEALDDPFADDPPLRVPHEHLFAIGDAADAFGAIKAGHCAYYQAEVAARNVMRLILRDRRAALDGLAPGETDPELELEAYVPGPPAIKVSLGLVRVCSSRRSAE